MNFIIIFFCLVVCVVLFGILMNRLMFNNDRLIYAVLLIFASALFFAAGAWLFWAGSWRTIAITLLIIGVALFAASVAVMLSRKK